MTDTKIPSKSNFDTETNTLTIDLGDTCDNVNILIKGKHLKDPISFTTKTKSRIIDDHTPKTLMTGSSSASEDDSANKIKTENITTLKTDDEKLVVKNIVDVPDSEQNAITNSQTNSGIIYHSQFSDGGFGDIGQQWREVHLHDSTVINNHTSINLTLSGGETIHIDGNNFGTGTTNSGKKNKDEHKKKVRDYRILKRTYKISKARRKNSKRSIVIRTSRNGENTFSTSSRRRSWCTVFLYKRSGFR